VQKHRRTRLFGKIRKECEEGKDVANHVFPISSVGIFVPMTSRYGATLFTLSIAKITAVLPLLY
jgi:histidinol dehydrogenase